MYPRKINFPSNQSFFLFGPRGTGKTSLLRHRFPQSCYLDLLESEIYNSLLASPQRLLDFIPKVKRRLPVIIDEIQKIPELLDEVHRLIESEKMVFLLTGTSARKLKRAGANLLAGRAWSYTMFPLTAQELGKDFSLKEALKFGLLPPTINSTQPQKFLASYAKTYLKEEIQQEGLTRNIAAFARFLEAASFSQASVLVPTRVASDCVVERKVVEDYFSILQDLFLSIELPVFKKRAKRELISKRKFYFFDVGVYRTFRPQGVLDAESEISGHCLETLVLQELRAINATLDLGYEIFFWHTKKK